MTAQEKETQDEKIKQFIKENELALGSRRHEDLFPRQYCMYHIRRLGYSLPAVGRFFNKDHATVINACKQVSNAIELNDEKFMQYTYYISNAINELNLDKVWKVEKAKKEEKNVFKQLINRVNEARDIQDLESVKAFINQNIDVSKV